MPWLAAALMSAFLMIAFPVRAAIQRRRYGRPSSPRPATPRPRVWRIADVLFFAGMALLLAGPVLEIAGSLDPLLESRPSTTVAAVGFHAFAIALLAWAQETMGLTWRPAIAPIDGGELVTAGPFRLVRNPNYVAMLAAGLGTVLLASDPVAIAGWLTLLTSLMLTARFEEGPLEARFGDAYREYAARVGRLFPGAGKRAR